MNQGSGAAPEPRGGLNRRRDHLGPTHWRAEMTIGAHNPGSRIMRAVIANTRTGS